MAYRYLSLVVCYRETNNLPATSLLTNKHANSEFLVDAKMRSLRACGPSEMPPLLTLQNGFSPRQTHIQTYTHIHTDADAG